MTKNIQEKKYTVREEPFGFTVYDHATLTRKFVAKNKLESYLKDNGILDYIYLEAKHKDYRKDILYSPLRIYYEVTLACNLHCKFCFNSSGVARPNELTTKEVIDSLHSLRNDNVIDLRFTGGELTRRPDWYEILKTAKDLGFVVSCNTNATWDSSIAEKFASLNLDQITISMDGTEEHHDKNRGQGNYRRTLNNMALLHKLGAKLRVNVLLTKLTLGDLEPLLDEISKYITEVNFFPVAFIGRGEGLESEYSMTMEEFYEFKLKADKVRTKYPNLNLLTFCEATKRTSVNKQDEEDLGLKMGTPTVINNFNITSDGGLWAGGYLPYIDKSLELGNIKKDTVYDVWQKKNSMLESLRNQAQKIKEFCYTCKEHGKRCPGADFELEVNRQLKPESKNYYCVYGQGEPLLNQLTKKLPYRDNVGSIVFKGDKYLLIQMIDWTDNLWKFPQGGVHEGETKKETAMRELKEELGTDKFKIIKQFPFKHQYDWDKESVKLAKFKWRGQKQTFFLVEFLGDEDEIKIDRDELRDYRWATKEEVLKLIDIKGHPLFKGYKKFIEKML